MRQSSARRILGIALCILFLGVPLLGMLAKPSLADSPPAASVEQDLPLDQLRRAQSIFKNTMSPFCPGRTLADCPSPYAAEWRTDIRRWIREGVSSEEIKRRIEERLPEGQHLSGAPGEGFGWAQPVLLFFGAVVLLGFVLRRLRSRAGQSKEPAASETKPNTKKGKTSRKRKERSADGSSDAAEKPAETERDSAKSKESELDQRLDEELARDDED